MYKQTSRRLVALLLGVVPLWAAAGISTTPPNPGFAEPTYSQAEYNANFGNGRTTGRLEVAAECIGDPSSCGCVDGIDPCGIGLSSVLSGAQYGETEPNDHIFAADSLVPEHSYWGQTPWVQDVPTVQGRIGEWHRDEDWYFVTTNEPNQILTINFTVPDRVLLDTSRLSQGWMISVRDAAGNIYAQFDTRFALDDETTPNKNESKEIVYPVFLGHVGTYYVTVEPRFLDTETDSEITNPTAASLDDMSVAFSPYNLAVVLEFSGMDTTPVDVNFFDVETEPNDTSATADPLATTVVMYGMLHANLTGNDQLGWGLQTGEDWFWYESPGSELITLAFCERADCSLGAGRVWRVTVMDESNTVMTSFRTDNAQTVRFGVEHPGIYFMQIVSALNVDEDGRLVDIECKEWSIPTEPGEESVCLRQAQIAMVTTRQYNFTWYGTKLSPFTAHQ